MNYIYFFSIFCFFLNAVNAMEPQDKIVVTLQFIDDRNYTQQYDLDALKTSNILHDMFEHFNPQQNDIIPMAEYCADDFNKVYLAMELLTSKEKNKRKQHSLIYHEYKDKEIRDLTQILTTANKLDIPSLNKILISSIAQKCDHLFEQPNKQNECLKEIQTTLQEPILFNTILSKMLTNIPILEEIPLAKNKNNISKAVKNKPAKIEVKYFSSPNQTVFTIYDVKKNSSKEFVVEYSLQNISRTIFNKKGDSFIISGIVKGIDEKNYNTILLYNHKEEKLSYVTSFTYNICENLDLYWSPSGNYFIYQYWDIQGNTTIGYFSVNKNGKTQLIKTITDYRRMEINPHLDIIYLLRPDCKADKYDLEIYNLATQKSIAHYPSTDYFRTVDLHYLSNDGKLLLIPTPYKRLLINTATNAVIKSWDKKDYIYWENNNELLVRKRTGYFTSEYKDDKRYVITYKNNADPTITQNDSQPSYLNPYIGAGIALSLAALIIYIKRF